MHSAGVPAGRAFALSVFLLTGCVPLSTHRSLQDEAARLRDINQGQERALAQAELRLRGIRARDESGEIVTAGYRDHLERSREENRRLLERALEAERRLADLQAIPPPPPSQVVVPGVVEEEPGRLVLEGEFFFASGSSVLRPEAAGSLDQLGALVRKTYPDRWIYIDGHTDRQPVKRTLEENRDNWLLGAKRAHAVFEYFARHGFGDPGEQTRFVLRSFGFGQERETGKVDSAKNRRVEILVGEPLETERRRS